MELLIGLAISVALMEIYAWLPKLAVWLVGRAVRRLPCEDQERCREEWSAGLAELPNTAWQIAHAVSFCWAARKISVECLGVNLEKLGQQVDEILRDRSSAVHEIHSAKARLEALFGSLVSVIDHKEYDATILGMDQVAAGASVLVDKFSWREPSHNALLAHISKALARLDDGERVAADLRQQYAYAVKSFEEGRSRKLYSALEKGVHPSLAALKANTLEVNTILTAADAEADVESAEMQKLLALLPEDSPKQG